MRKAPHRLTAAEIPTWVPGALKEVALRLPPSEVLLRLTTSARMESVWRELLRQNVVNNLADNHLLWLHRDTPLGLTRDDLTAYSPQEKAAAAFFANAVDALTQPPKAMTHAEHDARMQRFNDAADLCREQADRIDDDLKSALEKVGNFFAHQAEMLEARVADPQIIERRVGDDALRVQARLIAAWSLSLYGQRNLGSIATIMSIATGTEISKSQVEKWTARSSIKQRA
jgi:hypothetical protein